MTLRDLHLKIVRLWRIGTQWASQSKTEKVICDNCPALILPQTSLKNNGLCSPCKKQLEQSEFKHDAVVEYDNLIDHYTGEDLDDPLEVNAATHIGLFLAWAIKHDQLSATLKESAEQDLQAVVIERMTGREFLLKHCDEKLCSEHLNEVGNLFAKYYYRDDRYFADYVKLLGQDLESNYCIADTWVNYHKLEAHIDHIFAVWSKNQRSFLYRGVAFICNLFKMRSASKPD